MDANLPASSTAPTVLGRDEPMTNDGTRRRHFLILLAFVLAVLVFILPTYADLLWAAIHDGDRVAMGAAALVCFGIVLMPLAVGSALTRRRPHRYRKSRLATATWLILALWFLVSVFTWYSVSGEGRPTPGTQDVTSEVQAKTPP
jgi:hypothetical protein